MKSILCLFNVNFRKAKTEIEMIMNGKCDEALPKFLEGIQRYSKIQHINFTLKSEHHTYIQLFILKKFSIVYGQIMAYIQLLNLKCP